MPGSFIVRCSLRGVRVSGGGVAYLGGGRVFKGVDSPEETWDQRYSTPPTGTTKAGGTHPAGTFSGSK